MVLYRQYQSGTKNRIPLDANFARANERKMFMLNYKKYGVPVIDCIAVASRLIVSQLDVSLQWFDVDRINSFLSLYGFLNPFC